MNQQTNPNQSRVETVSSELLRQYIEGELTTQEEFAVKKMISESEEWRTEYERMENYLSALNSLPLHQPSPKVWQSISEQISQVKQRRVFFPWVYAHINLLLSSARVLSFVLIFLFGSYLFFSIQYPLLGNQVIRVNELSGFEGEADTYVVFHDLGANSSETTESLVALYSTVEAE